MVNVDERQEDATQCHSVEETNTGIAASDSDSVCLIYKSLLHGGPISMSKLCPTYNSILRRNGVRNLPQQRDLKDKFMPHEEDHTLHEVHSAG